MTRYMLKSRTKSRAKTKAKTKIRKNISKKFKTKTIKKTKTKDPNNITKDPNNIYITNKEYGKIISNNKLPITDILQQYLQSEPELRSINKYFSDSHRVTSKFKRPLFENYYIDLDKTITFDFIYYLTDLIGHKKLILLFQNLPIIILNSLKNQDYRAAIEQYNKIDENILEEYIPNLINICLTNYLSYRKKAYKPKPIYYENQKLYLHYIDIINILLRIYSIYPFDSEIFNYLDTFNFTYNVAGPRDHIDPKFIQTFVENKLTKEDKQLFLEIVKDEFEDNVEEF